MAGDFHVTVTFPKIHLHPEILDHLEAEEFYSSGKEKWNDPVSTLENCFDSSGLLVEIEHEENRYGELADLETLLKKHKVPYNRECSEGGGYVPEDYYYRPGEIEISVKTSDSEEYITSKDIQEALDKPNANLRTLIEELMDKNTSRNVKPLMDYTTATPLGRNKTAMERIDEVLAQLDAEEITQTEAFAQIAKIKEEENDDKE